MQNNLIYLNIKQHNCQRLKSQANCEPSRKYQLPPSEEWISPKPGTLYKVHKTQPHSYPTLLQNPKRTHISYRQIKMRNLHRPWKKRGVNLCKNILCNIRSKKTTPGSETQGGMTKFKMMWCIRSHHLFHIIIFFN